MTDSIAYIPRLMTASSHHAQQTYGMNVLYTAASDARHDRPYTLLTCSYVRSRSYHAYGIWHPTHSSKYC